MPRGLGPLCPPAVVNIFLIIHSITAQIHSLMLQIDTSKFSCWHSASVLSFSWMRKKKLCQAAWNTSVSDIFKLNRQITSLHTRPLGQAVQQQQNTNTPTIGWRSTAAHIKTVHFLCNVPFILLSFYTCYLHQRGCSSVAVSVCRTVTLEQEGGSELPSPVSVLWWLRYFRCHDYVTLLFKIC